MTETISNARKTYPFGTPQHGKHPYSEFAHLSVSNKAFALQIASSGEETNFYMPPILRETNKSTPTTPPIKKLFVPDIPHAEEGVKPCMRPECKEVMRAIIESQDRNRREREGLLEESKALVAEIQQTEQLILLAESEGKVCLAEGAQIEKSLGQLEGIKDELEKQKYEQAKEREELNNKLMMLEAEKQRWSGRLQRAEEALADVLWKRDSANQSQNQRSTTLSGSINFKPTYPRRRIDSLSDTEADCLTYYSLASQGMLDISELSQRKISSALSMPISRRMNGAAAAGNEGDLSLKSRQTRAHTSHRHRATGLGFGMPGSISGRAGSLTSLSISRNSKLSSGSNCASSVHRPLTNPKDGSLILQLPNPEAYKGYTPTGAPVNRDRASRRSLDTSEASSSHMSVSSMGDFSSASAGWRALDPVFYAESARALWGRSDRTGSVRIRDDPPGYRRKMLTAHGHPGLSMDEAI